MKKYTKEELKDKFVIVYDTIVEGKQSVLDDNEEPVLYNSEDEAFKEIFESNYEILDSHMDDEMLEEYSPDVTPELVETMSQISAYGDVNKMRQFMDMYPQCDYYEKSVEPAESFISPVTL